MKTAGLFATIYSRAGRTSVSVSDRLPNGAMLFVRTYSDWDDKADGLIARLVASGVRIEGDNRQPQQPAA